MKELILTGSAEELQSFRAFKVRYLHFIYAYLVLVLSSTVLVVVVCFLLQALNQSISPCSHRS